MGLLGKEKWQMREPENLEILTREQLIELIQIYAKDWLAIDGMWFQSIEAKYGMDEAMWHDIEVWKRFTITEARRVKKFLKLEEHPGLEGLAKAFKYRLYSNIGREEITLEGDSLIYRMVECKVQNTRLQKGMDLHPCRLVGDVEYAGFAKTIDDRIECECLSCYPDIKDDTCHCAWKFTIEK